MLPAFPYPQIQNIMPQPGFIIMKELPGIRMLISVLEQTIKYYVAINYSRARIVTHQQ